MKPQSQKPLAGQRPLFDECTPELVIYDGECLTQGVLFGPPEPVGQPPPIPPKEPDDADSDRDSPQVC
jgi:hypothetical protein